MFKTSFQYTSDSFFIYYFLSGTFASTNISSCSWHCKLVISMVTLRYPKYYQDEFKPNYHRQQIPSRKKTTATVPFLFHHRPYRSVNSFHVSSPFQSFCSPRSPFFVAPRRFRSLKVLCRHLRRRPQRRGGVITARRCFGGALSLPGVSVMICFSRNWLLFSSFVVWSMPCVYCGSALLRKPPPEFEIPLRTPIMKTGNKTLAKLRAEN